jgi:hypothetical protein
MLTALLLAWSWPARSPWTWRPAGRADHQRSSLNLPRDPHADLVSRRCHGHGRERLSIRVEGPVRAM